MNASKFKTKEMLLLGKSGKHYLYTPTKREETTTAIDKVSDILKSDFSYVCITGPEDHRINGYIDAVSDVTDGFDWNKYSLIIATKS